MPVRAELRNQIIRAAKEAAGRSHCPYTKYPVGAAVMTLDEKIFVGCYVENASPSLSSCAARNAIYTAVASGYTDIGLIVIYTPTKQPSPPCGACRQVINEFAPDAHVYCVCDSPEVLHRRLSAMLPDAFGSTML